MFGALCLRAAVRPACWAVSAFAVCVCLLITAADCSGPTDNCACFSCAAAITLSVVDEDGNAVNDGWSMRATVDGAQVDDFGACTPGTRVLNTCAFGSEAGVYRITVSGDGYATREISARVAAGTGVDCCSACVSPSKTVVAVLTRAEIP